MRWRNKDIVATNKKLKELSVLETKVVSSETSNHERSLTYDHSFKGNLKRVTIMVLVLETSLTCNLSSNVEQVEVMLLKMKEVGVLKNKQMFLFLLFRTIKHVFIVIVIFFSDIFSAPLTQLTLKNVIDLDSLMLCLINSLREIKCHLSFIHGI